MSKARIETRKEARRRTQRTRCTIVAVWTMLMLALGFALGGVFIPQACVADANTEPAPVVIQTYTDEELELLALVIYQEAGSDDCSDDTRLKTGEVVMNRVADPRFPDTIREVVLQRAQYGKLYWTGPEWPPRAYKDVEAHAVARAYDCAKKVLNGYRSLSSDTVFQAEFVQGDEVVTHQDGLYFCR